jgi:hypothetical protein
MNSTSTIATVLIIVSFFLDALLIALGIWNISHKKVGNPFLYLLLAFLNGLMLFLFVNIYNIGKEVTETVYTYDGGKSVLVSYKETPTGAILDSIYSAVKMFVFSIEYARTKAILISALGDNALCTCYRACIYIGMGFSFLLASNAVIRSFFRGFFAKAGNFWYGLRHNRVFIFTDMGWENVSDIVEKHQKSKDSVAVVINKQTVETQYGSEFKSLLIAKKVAVLSGNFSDRFFAGLAIGHLSKKKVIFYSIYREDKDNLLFAHEALNIYQSFAAEEGKKTWRSKRLARMEFYVSYQEESFREKFNFAGDTYDKIHLFNEYESVATRFAFENPLTRFLSFRPLALNKKPDEPLMEKHEIALGQGGEKGSYALAVHFLGFGHINQAILDRLIPAYQTDEDEMPVTFLLADKNVEVEAGGKKSDIGTEYAKRFESRNYIGSKAYLKQGTIFPDIKSYQCDFHSPSQLSSYVKEQVLPLMKEGLPAVIVVSVGSSLDNAEIAFSLRDLIKKYAKEENITLILPEGRKLVTIQAYVKENGLFIHSDLHKKDMEELGKKYKGKASDLDHLQWSNRQYFNLYENDLSFVFETKTPSEESKDERTKAFLNEELPVVVFGRSGYVPDENQPFTNLALNHSSLYQNWTCVLLYAQKMAGLAQKLASPLCQGNLRKAYFGQMLRLRKNFASLYESQEKGSEDKEHVEKKDYMKAAFDSYFASLSDEEGKLVLKPNFFSAFQKLQKSLEGKLEDKKPTYFRDVESDYSAIVNLNYYLNLLGYKLSFSKKPQTEDIERSSEEIEKVTSVFAAFRLMGDKEEKQIDNFLNRAKYFPSVVTINEIEHNRWTAFLSSRGDLPRKIDISSYQPHEGEVITGTKNLRKDIHLFLTSSSSFIALGDETLARQKEKPFDVINDFFRLDLTDFMYLDALLMDSGYCLVEDNSNKNQSGALSEIEKECAEHGLEKLK